MHSHFELIWIPFVLADLVGVDVELREFYLASSSLIQSKLLILHEGGIEPEPAYQKALKLRLVLDSDVNISADWQEIFD